MSAQSEPWIGNVRPSRRPLRGLLRMTFLLNSITDLRHPEERATGARLEGRTTTATAVVTRLLILFLVVLALAGCGKKGAPQPPPDEPNTFPRAYPSA
jgi:predicted small lipoprotein YifL